MPDFIRTLGSLPSGGKPMVFNSSSLRKPGEGASVEEQYSKATTDEQRKILYEIALAECEREKAAARMSIC